MQISELEKKFRKLEGRYLDPHLHKSDLSEEEEDDIRAFCVLSHAALEEYLETFATTFRDKLIRKWTTSHVVRKQAAVCMIAFLNTNGKSMKIEIAENEGATQTAPLHQIWSKLTEAEAAHKNRVDKNHGASKSYIRDLYVSLGFSDIADHGTMDAIGKLANNRGSYAHRVNHNPSSQFVLNKMSAAQLKQLIPDILRLNDELVRQAKAALPAEYPPFQYDLSDI